MPSYPDKVKHMHRRALTKQFLYGSGYLFVLSLIILSLWLLIKPKSDPTLLVSPTPQSFAQLELQSLDFIQHTNTLDLVAQLRNPNPDVGIGNLPVTFLLLDAQGQELNRITKTSYILPGSLQYVTAISIPAPDNLATIQLELPPEPVYSHLSSKFDLPTFNTILRERSQQDIAGQTMEIQSGNIRNNSSLNLNRVEVTALARDASGQLVGVGTTFLGVLNAGAARDFRLTWPVPSQPTNQVITLSTSNLYLEEAITDIQGDPNLLR